MRIFNLYLFFIFWIILLYSCSPTYRYFYTKDVNNRLQILAKTYGAKATPLIVDSSDSNSVKLSLKKRVDKNEINKTEKELLDLERYFATSPDCVAVNVDIKFTTPSKVNRIDSFYFNINKWNYLKKYGMITKNTYFVERKLK